MAKLKKLVIHSAAIPFGRKLTHDDLILWHMFPIKQSDGSFLYKGRIYLSANKLPNDIYLINGIKMPIRNYSNSGRGWKQIGYSDMINELAELSNLVPYTFDNFVDPAEITNGAAGYNSESRHIVLAGGHSKDGKIKNGIMEITKVFSDEQIQTLISYIRMQKEIVPTLDIVGHNELTKAKTCPNFDVQKFLKDYKVL